MHQPSRHMKSKKPQTEFWRRLDAFVVWSPYPSWCCQYCGKWIGYMGRFFAFFGLVHHCKNIKTLWSFFQINNPKKGGGNANKQ